MKTYPEINSMNLRQVNAALALASVNNRPENFTPEFYLEFRERIAALLDRKFRLRATARRVRVIRAAR